MYEARQRKEKVSRRIDGGDGLNQRKKRGDRKNISRTIEVGNNRESYSNCMQFMLTRAGINNTVDKILRNEDSLDNYDLYDQYLIIDRAIERNIDIKGIVSYDTSLFVTRMYSAAEENSDIDHPETSDAEEIPFVTPEEALQLKRGSGLSGPRTIDPFFQDGYYMRDSDGNIDFDQIYSCTIFNKSPVEPNSRVDLEEGLNNKKEFGVLLNGNIVHIPNASRSQHFSIANRIAKKHGQISGEGGHSPEGLTWHHLIDKYKMVLVNRIVHQKFGHNGGYYFW